MTKVNNIKNPGTNTNKEFTEATKATKILANIYINEILYLKTN